MFVMGLWSNEVRFLESEYDNKGIEMWCKNYRMTGFTHGFCSPAPKALKNKFRTLLQKKLLRINEWFTILTHADNINSNLDMYKLSIKSCEFLNPIFCIYFWLKKHQEHNFHLISLKLIEFEMLSVRF